MSHIASTVLIGPTLSLAPVTGNLPGCLVDICCFTSNLIVLKGKYDIFRAAIKYFSLSSAEYLFCTSKEMELNKTAQHYILVEFKFYIVIRIGRKASKKGKLWREKPSINIRILINICWLVN